MNAARARGRPERANPGMHDMDWVRCRACSSPGGDAGGSHAATRPGRAVALFKDHTEVMSNHSAGGARERIAMVARMDRACSAIG